MQLKPIGSFASKFRLGPVGEALIGPTEDFEHLDSTTAWVRQEVRRRTPRRYRSENCLEDDSGSGITPTSGINPIATYPQSSQTLLGVFGAGTSIFEAELVTTGLQLNADTTYWISGYGTDAAANSAGFNNFFAASPGAIGTTANGVIVAPGAGVADWTAVEAVIGGTPLAFSFAIDGTCATGGGGTPAAPARELPTLSQYALMLLALLMGGAGVMTTLRRRRED